MAEPVTTTAERISEPRERLLRVASELFYRDGIASTGVERILAEADVTRATLYRHFAGKEGLVEAYLAREDGIIRGFFADSEAQATSPRDNLERIVGNIADDALRNHTRGCPFINASVEYPDPKSKVRQRVRRHRDWFRKTLEEALSSSGETDVSDRARELLLLRDAALVGGYLDGPEAITEGFVESARRAAGLDGPR